MLDLTGEPIISVRASRGSRERLTLPETFSFLLRDEIESFTALRPHQEPAWHAFLVQVAALACDRAGVEPPADPAEWAALLRTLAGDHAEAGWSLVVEDPARPALLQPPLPPGATLADYRTTIATPDALDLLVTAKNHDLKPERMAQAWPEHWLYALVSLQTFEGVMGAGKYGISRMNGGYGSRPMLGVVPPGGPGARFRRDLAHRPRARDHARHKVEGLGSKRALGLVWLEPWDDERMLGMDELDPLYVEVCRRVRLTWRAGRIAARGVGSRKARIAVPDAMKGVTGDPWAPIDRSASKVLSVGRDGFGYRRMVDLLDGSKFARPPMAEVDAADAADGAAILAAALARGQGKTEGFHSRSIPARRNVLRLMGDRDAAGRLAAMGQARVLQVGDLSRRALRPALMALFQGGPDDIDVGKPTTVAQIEPWSRAFDGAVDRVFFDRLFAAFALSEGADPAAADAEEIAWERLLATLARKTLEDAIAAAPRMAARWYRARVRARGLFRAQSRRILTLLEKEEADARAAADARPAAV